MWWWRTCHWWFFGWAVFNFHGVPQPVKWKQWSVKLINCKHIGCSTDPNCRVTNWLGMYLEIGMLYGNLGPLPCMHCHVKQNSCPMLTLSSTSFRNCMIPLLSTTVRWSTLFSESRLTRYSSALECGAWILLLLSPSSPPLLSLKLMCLSTVSFRIVELWDPFNSESSCKLLVWIDLAFLSSIWTNFDEISELGDRKQQCISLGTTGSPMIRGLWMRTVLLLKWEEWCPSLKCGVSVRLIWMRVSSELFGWY